MSLRVPRAVRSIALAAAVGMLLLAGSFVLARRSASQVLQCRYLKPVEMSFAPHLWRRAPEEPIRLIVWHARACEVDNICCAFAPRIGLSATGEVLDGLFPQTERWIEQMRER
jgi:hypothetical protein